jgi:hypothetical protein
MPTDKERLDFLQKLNDRKLYTGKVILRESTTGRGWRLHETSREGTTSVREAIDNAMINNKRFVARRRIEKKTIH